MGAREGAVGYYAVYEGLVDGGAEEGAIARWRCLAWIVNECLLVG